MADTGAIAQPRPEPDDTSKRMPDVLAWFFEAKRLLVEAEERLEAGDVLPALSSLAAVPPLHRMLIDRCSTLLEGGDGNEADEPEAPTGMYLWPRG